MMHDQFSSAGAGPTTSSSAAPASSTRPRASTRCSTSASTAARSPQLGERLDVNGHRVIDGSGLVLAPAFVDPHVHLRTPGREDEETIATGTAAAAAGGYCAILAMPNTDPVVDTADVLRGLRARAGDRGADPGRLHGRDHDRPGRHAADRDGRARRGRRGRLHRRRPAGRDRRV